MAIKYKIYGYFVLRGRFVGASPQMGERWQICIHLLLHKYYEERIGVNVLFIYQQFNNTFCISMLDFLHWSLGELSLEILQYFQTPCAV